MQDKCPTKTRVIYIDAVKDENYVNLEKIADLIIKKFLENGITTERELSHIKLNEATQLYEVKFHLTVIRS